VARVTTSSRVDDRLIATVGEWRDRLVAVAHDLAAHPETNYAEFHAHDVLVDVLDGAGLDVEPHAGGLETAFVARAGSGSGPTVAILCEYDALPGVGHACGHNVIAAIGAGAGIAAGSVVDELDGRLVVLGTPAEEGGGGKVELLHAGAFEGIDVALMVHPADADLTRMDTIAVAQFVVRYEGLAAHAAAAPELGRNALDAAVLGYVNVAALRQHIAEDERIHGIFTEAGEAANVVPATAEAVWFVRSPTLASLEPLCERVRACLRAGAEAAGCAVTITPQGHPYAEMVDNPVLVERYVAIAATTGRQVGVPDSRRRVVGSTDMGNVSHLVPSIHPMIQVAPPDVAIHTAAFAEAAVSPAAERAVADGAQILARLAAACWSEEGLVDAAVRAHRSAIPSRRSDAL
jgi:amidohydrolase